MNITKLLVWITSVRQFLRISLLIVLAFYISANGFLSVILPSYAQYTKDIILILLLFISIPDIIPTLKTYRNIGIITMILAVYALSISIFYVSDMYDVIAMRYIFMLPMVVFITLLQPINTYKYYINSFMIGIIISALFGLWTLYFDGFSYLSPLYSNTISSWVPYSTLPLYHKTGDFIRIQGLSSGPVEYAHLLLMGIYIVVQSTLKRYYSIPLIALLLISITLSHTRAVYIGTLLLAFLYMYNTYKMRISTVFMSVISVIMVLSIMSIVYLTRYRSGTLEHIKRPLEGIEMMMNSGFIGDIGSIGSAQRMRNMAINNDDKAFITENVWIDYGVQIGIIGMLLMLVYWIILYYESRNILIIVMFIMTQMATIFDMTPISIAFGMIVAMSIIYKKKSVDT